MIRLFKMGITFLKNSKMLTFSAFLSIFFACFLSISMFQLSKSAEKSYVNSILEEYGDYQIGVSKNNGETFTDEETGYIKNSDGITNVSSGYYVSDFDGIYMVGVVDDNINKSRYKYTYPVKEKEIVINSYLGEKYGKNKDDILSLRGNEYMVKEVIAADSFTMSKVPLIIMDISELHKLLGDTDILQINYVLLQCDGNKDQSAVSEKLKNYSGDFLVSTVGQDEDMQKLVIIFKGMLKVLFVIVIIISGLFVASIFYEYMRKYRRDMAVIRTIGGRIKQVNMIFISMSLTVSFLGCIAGALACILFDGLLLNMLNEKINLFPGRVYIDPVVLIQMTAAVFVLFNLFVMIFFVARQKVLPIQIFRETDTGLRKKKNRLRFLEVRRLIGTDCYIGIKLLMPKFWQNFMFIFIIALITALSYTGQSSMKLLTENNYSYYRNLTKGFDAYGNIIMEKEPVPEDIIEIAEQIKENQVQCCMITGEFYEDEETEISDDDIAGFFAADTDLLMSGFKGEYLDGWKDIPIEERMVVTDKTAEYMGYELGDKVKINTSWLGGEKELIVAGIIKGDVWMGETDGIIVDIGNVIYTEEKPEGSYFAGTGYFYMNGDKKQLEDTINQMESKYGDFKGLVFEQIIEEGNTISMQRLAMIKIVMIVLTIVAGIGWLNSAKGLLLARENEYKVLRMLGATQKRVKRISWIQVISYIFSGIIMGIIIGLISVYLIWKSNVNENVTILVYWDNIAGIVLFLLGISLLLKPTVNKLAGLNNR